MCVWIPDTSTHALFPPRDYYDYHALSSSTWNWLWKYGSRLSRQRFQCPAAITMFIVLVCVVLAWQLLPNIEWIFLLLYTHISRDKYRSLLLINLPLWPPVNWCLCNWSMNVGRLYNPIKQLLVHRYRHLQPKVLSDSMVSCSRMANQCSHSIDYMLITSYMSVQIPLTSTRITWPTRSPRAVLVLLNCQVTWRSKTSWCCLSVSWALPRVGITLTGQSQRR